MVQKDDDEFGELPELTNRDLLRILMQEIVDTRKELKEDIANLDTKLSHRIDSVESRLHSVSSEIHTLRREVHQNQSTFIANQTALESRVKVLEMAA